jgi:hypothetical protein
VDQGDRRQTGHGDEADAARRRRVVGATASSARGCSGGAVDPSRSSAFYALTGATALTWTTGGSRPVRCTAGARGRAPPGGRTVLTGVAAFGTFYSRRWWRAASRCWTGLSARCSATPTKARGGLVFATTLVNGAAEELFFRGAVYDAAGARAVPVSTAAYVLATVPTRNPALMLASVVMGVLFAEQRRRTGGLQAPLITHLTWSALMLRFLPPLFKKRRTR